MMDSRYFVEERIILIQPYPPGTTEGEAHQMADDAGYRIVKFLNAPWGNPDAELDWIVAEIERKEDAA